MANLKERLSSKTPTWFRKIIWICSALAAAGTAMLVAEAQVTGFKLPHSLEVIAQWFVVAGLVGAAIAKTAQEGE